MAIGKTFIQILGPDEQFPNNPGFATIFLQKQTDVNKTVFGFNDGNGNTFSSFLVLAQGTSSGNSLSKIFDVNISNPSNGEALVYNSVSQKWENKTIAGGSSSEQIGASIDGLGSAIQVGSAGFSAPNYSGTVESWSIIGDYGATGSTVVDVRKNGVSIVGAGNKPTIVSGNSASQSVSGWTSASFVPGDFIEYNIESVSTFKNLNLFLNVTKL
jgi:hypothetical protein